MYNVRSNIIIILDIWKLHAHFSSPVLVTSIKFNNTVCCRFDQYFRKVKHYTTHLTIFIHFFSQKLIKHIKRHIFKCWGAGSSHLDMNCVSNALRMLVLIAFVLKNLQGKIFMTNCLNMWNFGKRTKQYLS